VPGGEQANAVINVGRRPWGAAIWGRHTSMSTEGWSIEVRDVQDSEGDRESSSEYLCEEVRVLVGRAY
jgi:hypothetical protein